MVLRRSSYVRSLPALRVCTTQSACSPSTRPRLVLEAAGNHVTFLFGANAYRVVEAIVSFTVG